MITSWKALCCAVRVGLFLLTATLVDSEGLERSCCWVVVLLTKQQQSNFREKTQSCDPRSKIVKSTQYSTVLRWKTYFWRVEYIYRFLIKIVTLGAQLFLRFLAKTVILSRQIYIPVTRDIPGDLVFILTARYIASAMYKPVKRMTILLSLILRQDGSGRIKTTK